MKQIKLTPKQKEIITAMREKDLVFTKDSSLTRFTFKGKTVQFEKALDLMRFGLMKVKYNVRGTTVYELTELGKTINL